MIRPSIKKDSDTPRESKFFSIFDSFPRIKMNRCGPSRGVGLRCRGGQIKDLCQILSHLGILEN